MDISSYHPKNHIRILTAASLFDGHDAAINMMRRLIQNVGVEVIHLGHNRSALEIVDAAIQEDVQAVAITSYQGGHIEFFKYIYDLLHQRGAGHIKIFGGGGGTILPKELDELHQYGITRLYSPDDGRKMGLQGMINELVEMSDFNLAELPQNPNISKFQHIARQITLAENNASTFQVATNSSIPVLGITGTGGAGKSSLTDEFVRRFLMENDNKSLAILSIDPSKRKTGGALLGDRIRMNAINSPQVYMRSLATRQSNAAISKSIVDAIEICKAANFDLIIVETSGIGQSGSEITEHADLSLYVMTAEYGAASQLEKIDMLDYADLIAINKFDKRGSLDALRDVRKQYRRNHNNWEGNDEDLPIYGTTASLFNDEGMNRLYRALMDKLSVKFKNLNNTFTHWNTSPHSLAHTNSHSIIPSNRVRYLAEIVETARWYAEWVQNQTQKAELAYGHQIVSKNGNEYLLKLDPECREILENWDAVLANYQNDEFVYEVRGKEIKVKTFTTSLSQLKISKVAVPRYSSWGDRLRWALTENFPGLFPYTAGVFDFKRAGEDPTRMFAGEGGPERTNRRFHYLSKSMPANRLSTAFDSVTLYGNDPDPRPDIYGKVGNSGVNVCKLDDAKILYAGFDLCNPSTSVSMTINGPAPIILAFFLNAAIDQQCEKYLSENSKLEEGVLGRRLLGTTGDSVLPKDIYEKIKADTLKQVRGTVQADILKEDQAQNTCIFSTEFALKMMGDVQEYFTKNQVKNFYSVSISGYHIAEAGANPISQLAFTLSNGFTLVEYYLSRGLHIDDFAPNLSFFFSNGMDPEYAVIGRVARRIWAKAMKHKYKANERSQKLKYHIQTSGRSLHAQEIAFNDIRTTLQALLAIYDNCNSLHTNAYDEAITTPTEESVRRAMAIQLVINKEFGLTKNENPLQGAFIIDELTDLVEEAVYQEFLSINERGGVLGAMERMYQRNKIQDESMYYETLKHNGVLPIVGVNTFLDPAGSPTIVPNEVIRSTEEEKQYAIESKLAFQLKNKDVSQKALNSLMQVALKNENIFESLMEVVKYCTLGQITEALYSVGGQYRRNM